MEFFICVDYDDKVPKDKDHDEEKRRFLAWNYLKINIWILNMI